MRIAVISDIHSNLDALSAVVANLPKYDELLCLGDIVGYGPQPNEVVEQLQRLHPSAVLMGNHDYAVVTGDTSDFSANAAVAVGWTRQHIKQSTIQYLSSLRAYTKLQLGEISVALFHGSPRDPLSEYIFPGIPEPFAKELIQEGGAKLVLLGHTHVSMIYSFDEQMLANPGSVGQPRDGDRRASYAILNITGRRYSFDIKRVEYDVESVAGKILHAGLPRFLAERLYVGM